MILGNTGVLGRYMGRIWIGIWIIGRNGWKDDGGRKWLGTSAGNIFDI